jgi:hypothetical protein
VQVRARGAESLARACACSCVSGAYAGAYGRARVRGTRGRSRASPSILARLWRILAGARAVVRACVRVRVRAFACCRLWYLAIGETYRDNLSGRA